MIVFPFAIIHHENLSKKYHFQISWRTFISEIPLKRPNTILQITSNLEFMTTNVNIPCWGSRKTIQRNRGWYVWLLIRAWGLLIKTMKVSWMFDYTLFFYIVCFHLIMLFAFIFFNVFWFTFLYKWQIMVIRDFLS